MNIAAVYISLFWGGQLEHVGALATSLSACQATIKDLGVLPLDLPSALTTLQPLQQTLAEGAGEISSQGRS